MKQFFFTKVLCEKNQMEYFVPLGTICLYVLLQETGLGEHKVKAKWIPTTVKVEDHVIVPDIDPNIENPDQFLEDYTTNMALSPMDKSKPLWEFHLLQLKTSYAGSVAVARFHHSLGDGMSLMSLLLV